MRTIETALWPLEKQTSNVGLGVFLDEEHAPSLAGLSEGERVLLVEPNELQVEAVARNSVIGDRIFWFGEIGSQGAIQGIYRDLANPALATMQPKQASTLLGALGIAQFRSERRVWR